MEPTNSFLFGNASPFETGASEPADALPDAFQLRNSVGSSFQNPLGRGVENDLSRSTSSGQTRKLKRGTPGRDILRADGDDLLFGGRGRDRLNARQGTGNNRLFGGGGADKLLAGRKDRLFGNGGKDFLTGLKGRGQNRLSGGSDNDRLFAGQRDILLGDGGNDYLDASRGGQRNRLKGGRGEDVLLAGFNDRLQGNQGADILWAGRGKNRLTGGKGRDQFWIVEGDVPDQRNILKDFNPGQDFLGISVSNDIRRFSDLDLIQQGNHTLIQFEGQDIALLRNVQLEALNADHFLFDPVFVEQRDGAETTTTVTLVSRAAKFQNEMGLFFTDDAQGRIGDVMPGDPEYAAQALSRDRRIRAFRPDDPDGTTVSVTLQPDQFLGWYLIQDGTINDLIATNPANLLGRDPIAFFSFKDANPDGISHLQYRSETELAWEDLTNGGDRSFDDLVFQVDFSFVKGEVVSPNNAPIVSVPAVQDVLSNTDLSIAGISVADDDVTDGDLEVSLSVGNGVLNLGETTGLTFSRGDGIADTSVVFRGTLAAINAALASLIYRSDAAFSGQDTLNLTVNDLGNTGAGGALTDRASVPINVTVLPTSNTLAGTVFVDANGNAAFDAAEQGQAGVNVFLDLNRNGFLNAGEPSQISDRNGQYRFDDVADGSYLVWQEVPAGFDPTSADSFFKTVEFVGDTTLEDVNFGNQAFVLPSGTASLAGLVWEDIDTDGTQNSLEAGLEGVTVYLDLNQNRQLDRNEPTQVTETDGSYQFAGLAAGRYDVRTAPQPGVFQTFPAAELVDVPGVNEAIAVPTAQQVTLGDGEVVGDINFGNKKSTVEVRGQVWEDANGNDFIDSDEPGLADITVYLDADNDGQFDPDEASVLTNSDGRYRFRDLAAGDYSVRQVVPLEFGLTALDALAYDISLEPGEVIEDINFGNQRFPDAENQAPEFVSEPITEGTAGANYSYQPIVIDPENNPLTFTLIDSPEGLTIEPETGLLEWVPNTEQLGDAPVMIQVSDSEGLIDTQTFTISIGQRENNTPVFVSVPLTEFSNAGAGDVSGSVSPTRLNLQLSEGEVFSDTVSITAGEQIPLVDVFLLLDDTGSFAESGPLLVSQFPGVIETLENRFPDVDFGFGLARYEDYAGVGLRERPNTNRKIYALNSPIISSDVPGFDIAFASALARIIPDQPFGVTDRPEALIEGLFQVATGAGFDGNGDGDTIDNGVAGSVMAQSALFSLRNEVPSFNTYELFPVDEVRDSSRSALTVEITDDENSTVARAGTALTFGEIVSGSVDTVGEEDVFTFSLPERTLVYMDEIEFSTGTTPNLSLESDLFSSNLDFDDGKIADLPAGDYNIVADSPFSILTGNYSFRILNIEEDAIDLEFNTPVNGSINPIKEADIFQFEAEAGDVVFLDIGADINPTFVRPGWRLLNPSLERTQFDSSFDATGVEALFRIDESGTQTLLLEGAFAFSSVTNVDYDIEIQKIPDRAFDATGNLGGVGFRPGALPIVLATADSETVYQPDGIDTITGVNGVELPLSSFIRDEDARLTTPDGRGASIQPTIDALNDLGALVIGLGADIDNIAGLNTSGSDPDVAPRRTLEGIATLTGAVNTSSNSIDSGIDGDPIDPGDPLYFLISQDSGERIANGIAAGVDAALTATSFDIDLSASSQDAEFQNLTGVVSGVVPGEQAEFSIELTGNGAAQEFDLLFTRPGTGIVLGSIPVSINNGYFYAAQAVDSDGDTLSYSLIEAPIGATIDADSGQIQWTPSEPGVFDFTIQVEDGRGGEATQSFSLTITDPNADNRDPVITSTPPTAAQSDREFRYQVVATDADGDILNYYLTDAPEGMLIDPETGAVSWTPSDRQLGPQTVSVRVIDERGGTATQTFTVDVAQNQLPVFDTTPNRTGDPNEPYRYDVDATDPDGSAVAYSLRDGFPTGMRINATSGLIEWTPTEDQEGQFPVTVFATDEDGGRSLQSFLLTVGTPDSGAGGGTTDSEIPIVSLGFSANVIDIGEDLNLQVRAIDNERIVSLVLEADGQPLTLTPGAIANGTLNEAIAQFDEAGLVDIVATATDNDGNIGTERLTVRVIDPSDTTPPIVELDVTEFETSGTVLTSLTDIIGTVRDENLEFYRLEMAPSNVADLNNLRVDDPDYVVLAEGNSNIDNDVIGEIDPRFFANDNYFVRVVAGDVNGNINIQGLSLALSSVNKPGQFSQEFVDLSIPLTGLPIEVTRTYNSFEANQQGDFGFGWSLGVQDARIQESTPVTDQNGLSLFTATPMKVGDTVTLTNPEGRRVTFTFQPEVTGASLVGAIWSPRFVPEAGVFDTLEVDDTNLSIRSDGSAGLFLFGFPYNPSEYRLTTRDGTVYQYDQFDGLERVSDRNGNTLTYSDAGITSSTGASIEFRRDTQGRITEIIDPLGKSIQYDYDVAGDLVLVTDRIGNQTELAYEQPQIPHYLTEVIDPLGRSGVRNEYDDQGQLIKIIDAEGNSVDLNFDSASSTQTVLDSLGNTTTLVYDARGNIISEVDALGGVTSSTYDGENNLLAEVNELGNETSFTYDDNGNVLTITDPLGNTTQLTYDAENQPLTLTNSLGNTIIKIYDNGGNLVLQVDEEGNATEYSYDSSGNLGTVIDSTGDVTRYAYNRAGLVTNLTDSEGNTTQFTYDNQGNVLSVTTPLNGKTTFAYDDTERLVQITDAEGNISRVEYDAAGQRTADIDSLGRRTEYIYDDRGLQTEIRYPDGTTEQFTYDANGQRIGAIDRAGRLTIFIYDELQRLVRTIYPDGSFISQEYDAAGQVIASIDENGNQTEFAYDSAGRRSLIRDASGNETRFTYDANDQLIAVMDALNRITRYEYDAMGRLTRTTFADGTTTQNIYDELGRVIQEIDPLGIATDFEYDSLDQLTAVVDANGGKTEYEYDGFGNLISQRDVLGRITRYEYDVRNNRVATVLPLGQRETYAYDAVGNLISTVDFNGDEIQYTYDSNDLIESESFEDGSTTSYEYTSTLQIESITDTRGTTTYTYDQRDRLTDRTDPDGTNVSYAYDLVGNRTSVTSPSGTVNYTYDALNRMNAVSDRNGAITSYGYDDADNLTETLLPNGVIETRSYDVLDRLVSLDQSNTTETIASYDYTYDAGGRRTEVIESTGRTTEYSYDNLHRLLEEDVVDPILGNRTTSYTYDAVGNRLTRNDSVNGLSTYIYDDNDQLSSVTADRAVTNFTYDDNGNTLTETGPDGTTTYSWDQENQLIRVETSDGEVVEYQYDAESNRVAEIVDSQETRFRIDDGQEFVQILEEYADDGTILVSYTYGTDLISQNRNGEEIFQHGDVQGSVQTVTGSSGEVSDDLTYDAFGQVVSQDGNTNITHQYTGEQFDSETDLTYLRARYYDSEHGRFLSRDPFEGFSDNPLSLNKYSYAENDPVNLVDPSGQLAIDLRLVLIPAIAIARTAGQFTLRTTFAVGTRTAAGTATREVVRQEFDVFGLPVAAKIACAFLQVASGISLAGAGLNISRIGGQDEGKLLNCGSEPESREPSPCDLLLVDATPDPNGGPEFRKLGGILRAEDEFNLLPGSELEGVKIVNNGNGLLRNKDLGGGWTASLRDFSSVGESRPTIQCDNKRENKTIKIRYI